LIIGELPVFIALVSTIDNQQLNTSEVGVTGLKIIDSMVGIRVRELFRKFVFHEQSTCKSVNAAKTLKTGAQQRANL
jgi:hypothetical protein